MLFYVKKRAEFNIDARFKNLLNLASFSFFTAF